MIAMLNCSHTPVSCDSCIFGLIIRVCPSSSSPMIVLRTVISALFVSCVVSIGHAASSVRLKPDIIVGQDGSGNFSTVQAAVDSLPANNRERTIIFIKNGTYTEHLRVENSFITFLGEDRFRTRLVWEINDPRNDPKANADRKGIASFNLHNANDIVIDNLT